MNDNAARSLDEVAELIRSLSEADWGRLHLIASRRAHGRGIEPKDLLQEAFCRVLGDGNRPCPRDESIIAFLAGVMRSIASGELDKVRRRPPLVAIANHGGDPVKGPDPIDVAPAADDIQIAKQEKAWLINLFDGDLEAQIILEGAMENINGQELRELTGLDQTAYDSKRRLIRRRINKADKERSLR